MQRIQLPDRQQMRVPAPQEARKLVAFIRQVLGCGCPDEVLADLKINPWPDAFAGLPLDALIDVGGRLLIAICASQPWVDVAQQLESYLQAGKRLRDRKGFNRFRFVVACDAPGTAAPAIKRHWDELAGEDDRLHLHLVYSSALPEPLK